MNINFERLRLQMHFRQLYDNLGAHDAELLIVDAFQRELARHEAMLAQQAPAHGQKQATHANHLTANDNKQLDNS
jgi:hypothetical protein